ncbi:hypothetical protein ACFL2Q_16335 [Thermodesulfobacteriota bacterium]
MRVFREERKYLIGRFRELIHRTTTVAEAYLDSVRSGMDRVMGAVHNEMEYLRKLESATATEKERHRHQIVEALEDVGDLTSRVEVIRSELDGFFEAIELDEERQPRQ